MSKNNNNKYPVTRLHRGQASYHERDVYYGNNATWKPCLMLTSNVDTYFIILLYFLMFQDVTLNNMTATCSDAASPER